MKTISQITSIVLASSIVASTMPRAQANPAVLVAPIGVCAGTAGLGCVVLGTVAVGTAVYVFWQYRKGEKTYVVQSTQDGSVIDTWDTEKENRHTVYGDVETCRKMGKRNRFGKMLEPINHGDGTVTCRFEGKQTSFGGN